MKEKIQPIYRELKERLAEAPTLTSNSDTTRDASLWNHLNNLVDELNAVTQTNWNRFKVTNIKSGQTTRTGPFWQYILVSDYRTKLSSLIGRLNGTYLFDQPAPSDTNPSTVITQNQIQTQTVSVQILLDIQSKIDAELPKHAEGTLERGFLEKLKASLATIKNVGEMVVTILKIAKDFGLSTEQLFKLFS